MKILNNKLFEGIFTPKETDIDVQKLANLIDAEFEAIELKIIPESGAEELNCFINVEQKVQKEGGRMILGWQIWKGPFIIEAECHAVWEDDNEELIDITPKPVGFKSILFIEDPRLVYEGKQIKSKRLNITNNKLVDDFISTHDLIFKLQNKGERANHYDLGKILNNDQIKEIENVFLLKDGISQILNNGGNEHSRCFCEGGRKYKNCHKLDLIKMLKKNKQ